MSNGQERLLVLAVVLRCFDWGQTISNVRAWALGTHHLFS
jgi:hypothetical protein